MKDYYDVLGLDPEASLQSIKLAYRRMAREVHPDRATFASRQEELAANDRMAAINEAYSILSDDKQRAGYDQQLRRERGATAPAATSAAVPPGPGQPAADLRQSGGIRITRPLTATSALVAQHAGQLRAKLLSARGALRWREIKLEGFDWALESGEWASHFCLAVRSFSMFNPAAAEKFVNYCTLAVETSARRLKKNSFFFLVLYPRATDGEKAAALARRILYIPAPSLAGVAVHGAAVDMGHARTAFLGSLKDITDKRWREAIKQLGVG